MFWNNLLYCFFLLTCFVGSAAQVIANELTDEPEVADSQVKPPAPSASEDAVAQAFENAGLFWQKELPSCWVLIFSRSLLTVITMEKPEWNGLCLTFKATPPSDSDLIDLYQQKPPFGTHVSDLNLRSNSQNIFLPSP